MRSLDAHQWHLLPPRNGDQSSCHPDTRTCNSTAMRDKHPCAGRSRWHRNRPTFHNACPSNRVDTSRRRSRSIGHCRCLRNMRFSHITRIKRFCSAHLDFGRCPLCKDDHRARTGSLRISIDRNSCNPSKFDSSWCKRRRFGRAAEYHMARWMRCNGNLWSPYSCTALE